MTIPGLTRRLRARAVAFDRWRDRPLNVKDTDFASRDWDVYETTIAAHTVAGGADAGFARVREALLRLDLFPTAKLELFADTTDGRAAIDALVVERIYFGPVGFEAAVRLTDLRDDGPLGPRVAVTWSTVQGHPERGYETFSAERLKTGAIHIDIRSKSRPAQILVWLGYPVSRWIQRRYTNAAVRHLADAAEGTISV